MKSNFKFSFIIAFLFIFKNLYCYEIIRDPIFENYFTNIGEELKLNKINIFLVKNKTANAFVIGDKIYFTTGLLKVIENEDTLKAIFLHEYGHVIKNHFNSKKINIHQSSNQSMFFSLLSVGLAALTSNENIAIGTTITLNSNLVNKISKHSLNFEIVADDYMINQIKKNEIYTSELISFLSKSINQSNNYFKTHPNSEDRINNLKNLDYKKSQNSYKFEWIKAKHTKNSKIKSFNVFFENLEKGIVYDDEILEIVDKKLINYEVFKKGLLKDNWDIEFHKLLMINNSPFLKIEYINYLLDNDLENKYETIEKFKFDKKIMSEYFYFYIYGKYYQKIDNNNLSNFYFCQFYRGLNSINKSDFFCEKYDIKDVPTLDKSYALFK